MLYFFYQFYSKYENSKCQFEHILSYLTFVHTIVQFLLTFYYNCIVSSYKIIIFFFFFQFLDSFIINYYIIDH